MLAVKLVVAIVALGVSIHMYLWRRRSRAEWRAYDRAHEGDDKAYRPSRAASRARRR